MGRMKEIYIEIMNRHGEIPVDFDIVEYKRQKDLQNARWQEHEEKAERAKREENKKDDAGLDGSSDSN